MELTLSIFSALVSMLALLIALTAYGHVRDAEQKRYDKPTAVNRGGQARDRPALSDDDRRVQAVARREHRNFMNYNGTTQTPIDPNTILADSDV